MANLLGWIKFGGKEAEIFYFEKGKRTGKKTTISEYNQIFQYSLSIITQEKKGWNSLKFL